MAFHWDETALPLDIMSTHLDQPRVGDASDASALGGINVISPVSAGALADLGYVVKLSRAMRIPAARLTEPDKAAVACTDRPSSESPQDS